MMAKRKRGIPETTPNKKRSKGGSPLQHRHGDIDPERDYKVKSILKENKTHFLIRWEDDEVTGEKFDDTWEPKENANQLAIDDWERQKANKKQTQSRGDRLKHGRLDGSRGIRPAESPRKQTPSRRARRVINSSSSAEERAPINGVHDTSEDLLEIDESQHDPTTTHPEPWRAGDEQTAAAIQPSSPSSSYHAGEYQKIPASQLVSGLLTQSRISSAPSPDPLNQQNISNAPYTSAQISATPATRDPETSSTPAGWSATKVVPDSQTLRTSEVADPPSPIPASQYTDFRPVDLRTSAASQPRAAADASPFDPSLATSDSGQFTHLPGPTIAPTPPAGAADGGDAHGKSVLTSGEGSPLRIRVGNVNGSARPFSPGGPGNRETQVNVNATLSAEADNFVQDPAIQDSNVLDLATQPSSHPEGTAVGSQPSLPASISAAVHIDLSNTQQQHSSLSKFAVTPPPRATREGENNQPPTQYSTWQSSFLLQSHLSGSSTTANRAISLPVEKSSAHIPSSPITPIPSQSIVAPKLGGSVPSRPPSFSSSSMDSSQRSTPSGSSPGLREQLRAMRAQSRLERASQLSKISSTAPPEPVSNSNAAGNATAAKPTARPALASPLLLARDGARSPSAVPAEEPLPVITLEEMNTSGRYETLLPQAQVENSDVHRNDEPERISSLEDQTNTAPQGIGAYAVPIYFIGHQRDQYPEMIYFYKDVVHRLLASRHPDETLVQDARHFVERIRRITLHPDLDNGETYTQYDVQPFQQADWDARCSAKFRFLKDLFVQLQGSKLRIAIIAEPGRLMDILETFLRGVQVPHERQGSQATSAAGDEEGVRAFLLESNAATGLQHSVDLVIAMDNSVDHNAKQVHNLSQAGHPPFISLVVPRSVEHVERCVSARLPPVAHLRALVSGIYQYRHEAGRSLGVDSPKPSAALLAEYLKSNGGQNWPLPALPDLKDFDSQTDSEIGDQAAEVTAAKSAGEKRSRGPEEIDLEGPMSSKRSRVESMAVGTSPVTQHQEGDTTHVSDSIEKLTQLDLQQEQAESGQMLTATELRFQKLLADRQYRLDEHIKVLADLQFRYEEQRTSLLAVTSERDRAIETAQQAVARLTEESNKMSNLRADNTKLKEELKETNARLLDHTVPERAAFEAVRQSLDQAKLDREKAEKRLEQASKDLAYVRDLYQSASNSAQASAAQVAEMESQLATAEAKATGEHAKLRQMGFDEHTKKLKNDFTKMKAMLNERDAALRARDEEIAKLKEASRGRMGTRGTSLPRSPRIPLGSPSRQTSPGSAPRALGLHPLRNG